MDKLGLGVGHEGAGGHFLDRMQGPVDDLQGRLHGRIDMIFADLVELVVDLVAMATHGHRGLSDLLHGTTVNRVRHEVEVPVLLVPTSGD